MKKLLLLILLAAAQAVIAQDTFPNSCDDYYLRHNKRDLVPVSISFQEKNISHPYQEVRLVVKHIGNVNMTGPAALMNVKIKGQTRGIYVSKPFNAGETRTITLAFNTGTLVHCQDTEIEIDTTHSVGQFGCQTWNNDKKTLKAYKIGGFCHIIRPIGPILPPVFPR